MVIVETPIFTRQVQDLLADDDYYPKNVRDDLTPAQVKILKQIVEKDYP